MPTPIASYASKATPVIADKLVGTDSADGSTKNFALSALPYARPAATLTQGSIPYVDAGGLLMQDNTNFYRDPTTGALKLFDLSGDLVNYSGLTFQGRKLEITEGTSAAPITEWGPTVHISRTENLTLGSTNVGVVNNGLTNSNRVQNDANAALEVTSINKTTSQMQQCAVFGGARTYSTVANTDAVGITGSGRAMPGAVGRGSGAYLEGIRDTTSGTLVGAEVRSQNNSSADSAYNASGASDVIGLWVTHSTTSTKRAGEAIGVAAISGAGSEYLYGLTFKPTSVLTGTIRDDSSSVTSLLLNGTHSGYGVDFNGGSFTAGAIRLPNNVQIVGRNSTNTNDVVMMAMDANNRVSLAGGFMSVDTSGIIRVSTTAFIEKDAGNGAYITMQSATELLTLSTGAAFTDTTANLLPAGAIIEYVATRVTTAITTAANFSVGDATTAARFTAAQNGIGLGSTTPGLDHWETGKQVQVAAAKVRITCNATPSAGVVRVTVGYRLVGAPTS